MKPFSSNHYQRWSKLPYPKEVTKPILKDENYTEWPLLLFKKYEHMHVVTSDFQTVKLQIKHPREINFQKELIESQERLISILNTKETLPHPLQDQPICFSILDELSTKYNLSETTAAKIRGLLSAALHDTLFISMNLKSLWDVARPVQLDTSLKTLYETPKTPAYPSTFAINHGVSEAMLQHFFPTDKKEISLKISSVINDYLQTGLTYPISVSEGFKLGNQLGEMIVYSHPIPHIQTIKMKKNTQQSSMNRK